MYIDENLKIEMKRMNAQINVLTKKEVNAKFNREDTSKITSKKEEIIEKRKKIEDELKKEYYEMGKEIKEKFYNNSENLMQYVKNGEALNKKYEKYENQIETIERTAGQLENKKDKKIVKRKIRGIKTRVKVQRFIGKIKNRLTLSKRVKEANKKIENTKEYLMSILNKARQELLDMGIKVDEFNFDDRDELEKQDIQDVQDNIKESKTQTKNIYTTSNRKENKEIKEDDLKVIYSAKYDRYMVKNLNTKETIITKRNQLKGIDKEKLAELTGKSLEDSINIDYNVLEVLYGYDKINGTHKAREYFENAQLGKSKKEREQDMKEAKIDIQYDLKGLYDKVPGEEIEEMVDKYSKEEINEILNNANKANKNGIGTVKKGLKVTIIEKISKLSERFNKNRLRKPSKILQIPEKIKAQKEEKEEKELSTKRNKNIDEMLNRVVQKEKDKEDEKIEKANEYFEKSKQAREELKERMKIAQNAKYEYKNNNYSIVKNEEEKEEKAR